MNHPERATGPNTPRTTEFALCRDAQGTLSLRGIVPVGTKVCMCRIPVESSMLERIARERDVFAEVGGMTQVDADFVACTIASAIAATQDELSSALDRLQGLLRCTPLLRRAA